MEGVALHTSCRMVKLGRWEEGPALPNPSVRQLGVLAAQAVTEVAVGSALHNRLGTGQLNSGVETLDEGVVTVAGEQRT